MTDTLNTTAKLSSKPRRIAAIIAGLALAAALSGCVVYPAGPGYYHGYYWHHDRDWR